MTTYYVAYQLADRRDFWGWGYVTLGLPQPITTVAHVTVIEASATAQQTVYVLRARAVA